MGFGQGHQYQMTGNGFRTRVSILKGGKRASGNDIIIE
jgi:hypothetical protein